MMMKDPSNRTKIVIRHLPPTLSQTSLFEHINFRFAGRYNWFSFRPGKKSLKDQIFARAYINLNRPDDVFEFAEFFNGHVFVNEKGAQFKAIVEYSPSQRVPRQSIKKDGREGTIFKDPEYLDFLECIAKPPENLPSADIQLERREAERAGIQEPIIVTPLMEFIRKKRAAKSGNHASSDGKPGGRVRTASQSKSRSTKQVSDKKRYILKTSVKNASGKEKPTSILVSHRSDQSEASSGTNVLENQSGNVYHDAGKKKILLLRGKEKEISNISDALSSNDIAASPNENSNISTAIKRNQRHDSSGRIIRSILLKDKSSPPIQPEQQVQILSSEKGKRPPRPANVKSIASEQSPGTSTSVGKRSGDEKYIGNDSHAIVTIRDNKHERVERRTARKERHESGVWAPRHSSNEHSPLHSESGEDPQRRYGRRSSHVKDENLASEGKSSKRGGPSVHGFPEDAQKQVWVQKSASGS